MIRVRLNKKQVLNDCKKILLFLNNELNNVAPRIQESHFCTYSDNGKYLDMAEEVENNQKILLLKLEEN